MTLIFGILLQAEDRLSLGGSPYAEAIFVRARRRGMLVCRPLEGCTVEADGHGAWVLLVRGLLVGYTSLISGLGVIGERKRRRQFLSVHSDCN